MTTTTRNVTIDTRSVGESFGTVGIVRDARTGRKIAESDKTRPYGFIEAAVGDARQIADGRGWTVVGGDTE